MAITHESVARHIPPITFRCSYTFYHIELLRTDRLMRHCRLRLTSSIAVGTQNIPLLTTKRLSNTLPRVLTQYLLEALPTPQLVHRLGNFRWVPMSTAPRIQYSRYGRRSNRGLIALTISRR